MDGFINVLKPPGMSSGSVVGLVRYVTKEKTGHAGTLDPEACGVLPVMVGRATRLFDFLVEKRKTYLAEIAFGCSTDTQDAQGTVLEEGTNYPDLDQVKAVLPSFIGTVMQTPPIYSALKQDGQPLYKLARKGETAEIPARPVEIYGIDAIAETPRHGCLIRVRCGRGTYIRTLCNDIGKALHCPAHMRFLLREETGAFDISKAYTIEEVKDAGEEGRLNEMLLPLDAPLQHIPRVDIGDRYARFFMNGVPLRRDEWTGDYSADTALRVYAQNRFSGMAFVTEDGFLKSCVIFK